MPNSAVILLFRGGSIEVRLDLPMAELKLGSQIPMSLDPVASVLDYSPAIEKYVLQHIHPATPDGRPWTVVVHAIEPVPEEIPDVRLRLTMKPPSGAPLDRLTFRYSVIFDRLINHMAIVSVGSDWRNGKLDANPEVLGTMGDANPSLQIDRSQGSWLRGFSAIFRLGARHISEGTDHLLFLLALLLPAPLLANGKRWKGYAGGKAAFVRILKVVSSFTVGHSITLIFGALGWVHFPSALIESLIALSIFVSAIHALVPIFRGREVFIAGGFGLVHGLAFASTLTEFGFDSTTLVSSILGFNLGIEAVQLLVIAATMPWSILLSRTRFYPVFRVIGASLTGVAAASWFFERAMGWANPIGPWVEKAASKAVWVLVSIAVSSLLMTLLERTALQRKAAIQAVDAEA